MSDQRSSGRAYVIDVADVVAGIVVDVDRGFRFFSAGPAFFPLEDRVFRDPAAAQSAVREIQAKRRRSRLRIA
jgi:hypothetical protein